MKTDKHEVSHRDGTAATDGSSACLCELVFHLKIPFSECSHIPEIVFPSCAVEVHMEGLAGRVSAQVCRRGLKTQSLSVDGSAGGVDWD